MSSRRVYYFLKKPCRCLFVHYFWRCFQSCHKETLRTDLNFNAISQVRGNQVVALLCRVGTLQDFHVSLGVGKIQIAWLCGRQLKKTSHSLFLDNGQSTSVSTISNCFCWFLIQKHPWNHNNSDTGATLLFPLEKWIVEYSMQIQQRCSFSWWYWICEQSHL